MSVSQSCQSHTPPLASLMDVHPPSAGSARLARTNRLRRRQDFQKAQATGRRLHTPSFGVCLAPNRKGYPRLGLVVGKRVGHAVRRNRVKRLLREFFRRHKDMLPPRDVIIFAKPGAAELSYPQVKEELSRVLLTEWHGKPENTR